MRVNKCIPLLVFIAGCSSVAPGEPIVTPDASPDAAGTRGTSGTAGTGGTAGGAGAGGSTDRDGAIDRDPSACVGSVWKASSRRVEIRSFGFFQGSSGYAQDRSAMTSTQLAALEGLCLIPTPVLRVFDSMTYLITIGDEDGTQTSYRASEGNLLEGNEGLPTLDVHTLEPFLGTFACLRAGATRSPPSDDAGPPWSNAPTVSTDPGCLNGVFVPYACQQVWLKLDVPAPLTYRIEEVACFGMTSLKLFAADGTTQLEVSDPGSASPCPAIDYKFDLAGTYLIVIDKTNAGACDAGGTGPAGDLFLRITRP